MLGGDMVEGASIFPGQAFEVEAGAFEQLIHTAGTISSVVWQITYPSGRRLTVPSNGWDEIRVVDDLA